MEWMPGGVVDFGGKGVGARGRRRESPGFFTRDRTGEVRYRFTVLVRSGTGRKSDEFKFEFKPRSTIGSDRYTDRFNRYTGPVRICVEFDVF
jgi:hypothetical protein